MHCKYLCTSQLNTSVIEIKVVKTMTEPLLVVLDETIHTRECNWTTAVAHTTSFIKQMLGSHCKYLSRKSTNLSRVSVPVVLQMYYI